MPDLVIVGNVSIDSVFINGYLSTRRIGGAAFNIGVGASLTGHLPRLISVVGRDLEEGDQQLLSALGSQGIRFDDGRTCKFDLIYRSLESDPEIQSDLGVATALVEHACRSVVPTRHLHICSRHPMEPDIVFGAWSSLLPRPSFSIDFLISSISDQANRAQSLMAAANYIFVNSAEYLILRRIIPKLDDLSAIIIITLGSHGAEAIVHGQTIQRVDGARVEHITDVVGAGDIFCGVFLGHTLHGYSLAEAMKAASHQAGESIKGAGTAHLLYGNGGTR